MEGDDMEVATIITGVVLLWPGLMYLLPPKLSKKLKPFGRFLKAIANTPGGLKLK